MITKVFEFIAKTDKADKDVKEFSQSIENVNNNLEQTNKDVVALKKSGKAFDTLKKGAKGVAGGFKSMGTALKAAGIGLIIGAFATLKELFEQNQKVVDIFSTSFEFLGLIFSQVGDAIKTVYDNVSQSSSNFDALGKVLKNILNIAL